MVDLVPVASFARDATTAARATWGVASSNTMPRWQEWMATVEAERARERRHNLQPAALEAELARIASQHDARPRDGLPWDGMRPPRTRRLYAGLVSFVDDYPGPYPHELFPEEPTRALRRALRSRAAGGVLTIDDQLSVAMELTDSAFSAAVLLHAVTRAIARNRDTRAHGELPWRERTRDAAWIAPFAPEIAERGDPPGDTYHYWANFIVGMHTVLRGGLGSRAVGAAFFAGPVAMTLIRQGLFGRELFAGAHARCDRLGLRHGRAVAQRVRRKT